ncbi:hypothetical protein D9M71_755940 [compost metagenome]
MRLLIEIPNLLKLFYGNSSRIICGLLQACPASSMYTCIIPKLIISGLVVAFTNFNKTRAELVRMIDKLDDITTIFRKVFEADIVLSKIQ